MHSKKGQVTEQFNWVFAIVAGGIILLFFLFVLGQIKTTADAKLAVTVLNNFDAIITGSSVTANSLSIIDSSKLIKFDVSCEDDGLSELLLSGSKMGRINLNQRALFSPTSSGGQRLYMYVLPIIRPFNIGNAMLLTGDDVFFGVYNPNDKPGIKAIYTLLPDNISKEYVSMFTNNHKRYSKLVIYSDVSPPDMSNSYSNVLGQEVLKKLDVTWIKLSLTGDQLTKANVFQKTTKEQEFTFIDEVSLPSNEFALFLGFSKDVTFYKCNLKKIDKKLSVVSTIYLKRTRMLISNAKSDCTSKYLDAERLLQILSSSDSPYSENDVIDTLKDINYGLLLNSCPLIY